MDSNEGFGKSVLKLSVVLLCSPRVLYSRFLKQCIYFNIVVFFFDTSHMHWVVLFDVVALVPLENLE